MQTVTWSPFTLQNTCISWLNDDITCLIQQDHRAQLARLKSPCDYRNHPSNEKLKSHKAPLCALLTSTLRGIDPGHRGHDGGPDHGVSTDEAIASTILGPPHDHPVISDRPRHQPCLPWASCWAPGASPGGRSSRHACACRARVWRCFAPASSSRQGSACSRLKPRQIVSTIHRQRPLCSLARSATHRPEELWCCRPLTRSRR